MISEELWHDHLKNLPFGEELQLYIPIHVDDCGAYVRKKTCSLANFEIMYNWYCTRGLDVGFSYPDEITFLSTWNIDHGRRPSAVLTDRLADATSHGQNAPQCGNAM